MNNLNKKGVGQKKWWMSDLCFCLAYIEILVRFYDISLLIYRVIYYIFRDIYRYLAYPLWHNDIDWIIIRCGDGFFGLSVTFWSIPSQLFSIPVFINHRFNACNLFTVCTFLQATWDIFSALNLAKYFLKF